MPAAGRTPHPTLAWSSAARPGGAEPRQQGEGRRERDSFQEKGGQPAPAICNRRPGGDRGSPEHCTGWGRPCRPPEVKLHAGTCNPWGRRSPLCPVSHPAVHRGTQTVVQSIGVAAPHSLPKVALYTDAATGEQPWPRVAVAEDISGARKAGVPSAPRQTAVHGGPCLPGPATEPPTTRGPHFKQLCSAYSSSPYYAPYSPTKQSSKPSPHLSHSPKQHH